MKSERVQRVLELMFFDPPVDLGRRLVGGEFTLWRDATHAVDLEPRVAFLHRPEQGGPAVPMADAAAAGSLLTGLQDTYALQLLDNDQPLWIYLSLAIAVGQQARETAMLMERLNQATLNQEQINADH